MPTYNKSDFARNKYSDAIVYYSATGAYELTEKQFLADNPSMTHEDFMFWKSWSDNEYKEELRLTVTEERNTIPLDTLVETEQLSANSAEDEFIISESSVIHTMEDAMKALSCLTETQRKRYLLHFCDGLSTWDIAKIEGTNQKSVFESITSAQKKINKFLQNTPSKV